MDGDGSGGPRDAYGLDGQVAVVTGASSGLGRACAIALGAAGMRVVVNHLPGDEAAAREACDEVRQAGSEAVPLAADVSDEEQVERLFSGALQRFGDLHVLVNNAGLQRGGKLQDMTLAQWRKVIDVNLSGQFLCARAAIRHFLQRGPQPEVSASLGRIVCMSSVHQVIPWAFEANYAASKGGVALLMQSIAQEFATHKVRVNAVAPGAIRTPINRAAWDSEAALEELLRLIPYGRIGEPRDIANAVLWLASDLSDYVNGTTLFVDGGMALYPGFRGAG